MSGLTSEGFVRARLADIKTEIENTLKAELGDSLNLVAPSVFSQIIGAFAEREDSLWQLAENVYNSQYPDTAQGTSLDQVVSITGITRQEATKTLVQNVNLFGTVGTTVPASTIFSVEDNPDSTFETDNAVTLMAGVDEVQTITFSATPVGGNWALRYEDETTSSFGAAPAASAIETELNALNDLSGVTVSGSVASGFSVTFAGNDGKIDQPLLVVPTNTLVDGSSNSITITVTETVKGEAQGLVDCTAETAGPVVANARTLINIDTPVTGLDRVLNMNDGVTGRARETDAELRLRRAQSLQIAGAGTVEAIRSSILNVDSVTNALVFENDTNITDADGLPPKSFEAVVQGGIAQDIANTIWDVKPAGIESFGSISNSVTDSQGNTQTVYFSRPTEIDIWVEADLTVAAGFDATAQVQEALVTRGNQFGIGGDVIVIPRLVCALDSISGILDVDLRVGTSASPSGNNNINIEADEIAVFDTSRTTVTVL